MSTGTADLKEIERSYSFLKKKGLRDISLLYYVTKYPAEPKDFNLNNIKLLKKKFNCTVGFSDHSNNDNVVKSAIAAGAEIIEKHIDIENKRNSLDSNFSIKSKELKNLIDELILIKKMFIKREYHLSDAEIKNRNQRRSIYVIKEISKNEKFGVKNLKSLRPYNGLASEIYFKLIGLRSHSKLKYGSKINLSTFRKILKYNKSYMLKISYGKQSIDDEDVYSVGKSLKNEKITTGPLIKKFESKIKELLKCNYASVCNSGTSAIFLALKSIEVKKNDIIIMPSVNFIASYNVSNFLGAKIYLTDVDKYTGQMRPIDLENCIKNLKSRKLKL